MKTKRTFSEAEDKDEPTQTRLSIVKDYENSLTRSKQLKEPVLCHFEESWVFV